MAILNGTIIDKLPSKSGVGARGPWTLAKFNLLSADGQTVKCQTFDKLKADVGDEVSLTGALDEQYKTFKATKISLVDSEEPESEPVTKPSLAKKALATSVKPSPVKAEAPVSGDSDREKNRSLAVASVKANLLSAMTLAQELDLETVDLIALADMIGRTISAITIGQSRKF